MKKPIKLVGLALIAMSMMSVASCGGKDNDVTPPEQDDVETETNLRLIKAGDETYTYDNKGRCIAIKTKYHSYTVDWDKGEILDSDSDNSARYSWDFKTDSNGLITEYAREWEYGDESVNEQGNEKTVFTYDKAGHLTIVVFNSTAPDLVGDGEFKQYKKIVLTWEDGNLVQVNAALDYTDFGIRHVTEDNYEITYDSGKKNVHEQWSQGILQLFDIPLSSELGNIGMYGTGTVDFPVNIKVDKDNHSSTYNYPVKISANKDGYIDREIVDDKTYNYLYEEVGMRSVAF